MTAAARGLRRGATISATLLAAAGATSLLGWCVGVARLKAIVFSGVAMNPVTAIGFIAIAAALRCALLPGARPATARAGLGAFIALAAVLRIAANCGVCRRSPDEVLFAGALEGNHMAPTTAACFLLFGLALVSFDLAHKHLRPIATWLLLGTATIAWLATVGYIFDVLSFCRLPANIPMAVPTAIGFLLAYAGACCARPSHEPAATLASQSAGGTIARRMVPIAIVVPVLIGWLRLEAQRTGVLSTETGVCMMVAATSAAFLAGLWSCGRALAEVDRQRTRAQDAMREMSLVDELTGLRNRRGFFELAHQQLLIARRQQRPMVLCFLDLDGLKRINDVHGHRAGDSAITDFASLLRRTFRESDILARLGGDEFVVLALDSKDAVSIAARFEAELRSYNGVERAFRLAASVGISIFDPAAPRDVEALLGEADAGMYAAKRARAPHVAHQPSEARGEGLVEGAR